MSPERYFHPSEMTPLLVDENGEMLPENTPPDESCIWIPRWLYEDMKRKREES